MLGFELLVRLCIIADGDSRLGRLGKGDAWVTPMLSWTGTQSSLPCPPSIEVEGLGQEAE